MGSRHCVMCARRIRESNKRAVFLFLRPRPDGEPVEVWVCGPECEEAFNES